MSGKIFLELKVQIGDNDKNYKARDKQNALSTLKTFTQCLGCTTGKFSKIPWGNEDIPHMHPNEVKAKGQCQSRFISLDQRNFICSEGIIQTNWVPHLASYAFRIGTRM